MKTQTKITLIRKTIFTPDSKQKDGGRALLAEALELITEALDLIREEGNVGALTAQIGPGGSIASLVFVKEDRIPVNSGGIVFDNEGEFAAGSVTVEV
jgi:hypothetical protein